MFLSFLLGTSFCSTTVNTYRNLNINCVSVISFLEEGILYFLIPPTPPKPEKIEDPPGGLDVHLGITPELLS